MEKFENDDTSERIERFCEAMLIEPNQTKAAIKAGYSEKTAVNQASRLLKNPRVQKRLAELRAERSERVKIDADYVLTTIRDTVERCRQAEPVKDRQGNPVLVEVEGGECVPAFQFDSNGVLRGCELLGKHLKLFTDKHEHSGPDGKPIQIDVSELTDDEVEARFNELIAKAAAGPS
jgi:phage terminase small subunit